MLVKIILSVLFYSIALTAADTYEGFKIYDVAANNEFQKEMLLRLSENDEYDFFVLPKALGKAARVMVQPKNQLEFENYIKNVSMQLIIVDENVGKTAESERIQNQLLRSVLYAPSLSPRINFNRYPRLAEIYAYLDYLATYYNRYVEVNIVGKSYENRDIKTITISNGDGKKNKKVIIIDAGIHAREWVAHVGALYVIQQLVENFHENRHLLQDYIWIILPVVNPDGYEYSHTNARMWRKTRKPNSYCIGTDGNRNFNFHWGEIGASNNGCSDTYMGSNAFSEPETRVVRDLLLSKTGRAKFYLTLHTFGQYMLYPWGYTSNLPDTWRHLDEVAQVGAAAIRAATGTTYTVGSSTNVLYAAAGGSDDYAFAVAKIPISITMELPSGGSGFNPPTQYIKPFVKETWIGIKAMAERVIKKY